MKIISTDEYDDPVLQMPVHNSDMEQRGLLSETDGTNKLLWAANNDTALNERSTKE